MVDTKDRLIVMTCDDLAQLLTAVKENKYWYLYDSDQNRDGQGEWHADVWLSNEIELKEDGWGDGDECFSFDSIDKYIK